MGLSSRQPEPTIGVLAFREEALSVVKFIELSGRSSESFEDAIRQTVERASRTIRNIQSVWVKEFEGVVENNQVTQFQVVVKLSFLVGEGMPVGAMAEADEEAGFVPGTP